MDIVIPELQTLLLGGAPVRRLLACGTRTGCGRLTSGPIMETPSSPVDALLVFAVWGIQRHACEAERPSAASLFSFPALLLWAHP